METEPGDRSRYFQMTNFLLQNSICVCEQIENMRPCELCGRAAYDTDVIVTVKHPKLQRFKTAKVVSRFEREGWMSAYRVKFFCDGSEWSIGQRDCTILGEGRKHIENVPVVNDPRIWNPERKKNMKNISTGQLIRNIRQHFNMSQRGLARESGLNFQTIQNVENGTTQPQLHTLELIILTFKIERLKELQKEGPDAKGVK